MAEFLFYQNRNNKDPFGNLKIPERFQIQFSRDPNCRLFSSASKESIYHIKNERIDFYLIGNFTFYKGFKVSLDTLTQGNEINKEELNHIFRKINGTYCCLLVNNLINEVNLITDFLGFYPVYFYHDKNLTVFSSALNNFKLFDTIGLQLHDEAIYSYLKNGHLMLDQSWFQEVKRTRPASIYTLNLNDGRLKNEYYWTWAKVGKKELPKKELIETYASLFTKGIEDLDIPTDSKNGLSLSGGLDSRWIAQIAEKHFNVEAFTFSSGKNYETHISEQVALALHMNHNIAIIHKENWLLNRLNAFWKTDGMLHLGHLHEGNIYKETHSSYSHCFHGFYGGGIYASRRECNQRITNDIAKSHFTCKNSNLNTEDSFYQTDSIDPYIADQKIRYQSAYSIYLLSSYCKMIIPFYNMDWIEFNYSIDDKLQLNSKFYLEVLKSNLTDALQNIPWQRTGLLPRYIHLNVQSLKIKIPRIIESISQRFHSSRHFINYNYFDSEIAHWIREFKTDISNLQMNYPLNSRERKLRMLSLVVWLKMISKNSPDVL